MSINDVVGIIELGATIATDERVTVSIECVMGLDFGTPWHTSYTGTFSASSTSAAQPEARQLKAPSPSVKPERALLVHQQFRSG